MNTPSHLIITAALGHYMWHRHSIRPQWSAWLWGSVLPDIPLYVLAFGGIGYYHFGQGWELRRTLTYMFQTLFFTNPWWMTLHNFGHAPLVLLTAGYWVRNWLWGRWLVLACALHTAIDIPVHVTDGPLLFFPLEWTVRWRSPVSYWDPHYYGQEFTIVEGVLDLLLLIYLFQGWIRNKRAKMTNGV